MSEKYVPTNADKAWLKDTTNGYIAFYNGKQIDVRARTSYEAQQIAAGEFKTKKLYLITVVLAEKDGKQVEHKPMF